MNNLPVLLKRNSWSVYRFAKLAGLVHHQAQSIVTSEHIPPGTEYRTLQKMARVLGCKIDDFETDDEPAEPAA